jgi:hypothetical protein
MLSGEETFLAMNAVGQTPESGFRLEIERARGGGPPWTYEGAAVTPEATFPVRAVLAVDGDVKVELSAATLVPRQAPPAPLADTLRRIVRTAYRHARDEDPQAPPPRRIVRWRAGP